MPPKKKSGQCTICVSENCSTLYEGSQLRPDPRLSEKERTDDNRLCTKHYDPIQYAKKRKLEADAADTYSWDYLI